MRSRKLQVDLEPEASGPRRGFVRSLTGIRAVAALWVLLGHYSSFLIDDFRFPRESLLQPVFRSAYAGVDLFFVLSGFIIAYTYYDSFVTQRWRASPGFWWKRFSRIYPVYILTTFLSAAMYGGAIALGHQFRNADGAVLTWRNAVLNVFGIQEWVGFPSLNGPAWSVSAELFAYTIFPLMAMLAMNVIRRSFLLALIGMCTVGLAFMSAQSILSPRIWQVFCEFLTGFLTYRPFTQSRRGHQRFATTWWFRGALWVVMFAVVYVSGLNAVEGHVALSPLCAVIVWSYAHDGRGSSLLDSRVMVSLGLWSYSLYLIHRPIQGAAAGIHLRSSGNAVIDGVVFVLLLASAIGCSWFLYRFVEEPARHYLSLRPYFRPITPLPHAP